tara:strand:- start:7423 stop:7620 length:198 start_codon:yes stop_codon:yes gene_type:complete
VNKKRITIATTTGITTIAVDSICAYTYVTSPSLRCECVQIHLKSGTIFTTINVKEFEVVMKEVEQ